MRDLTDEEKKFCEKQVVRLNEEKSQLEWLIEYNQLMLNKGLRMNYEAKVRQVKEEQNVIDGDLKITLEKIRVLRKQIKEGVEVKNMEDVPVGIN